MNSGTIENGRAAIRFRLAAEVTSDMIYEWDINNNSIEWFGDIDHILGYQPGEFPRTLEAWISRIHPEDQARLENTIQQYKTAKEKIHTEYRIQRKDGEWLHWIDRALPILDNSEYPSKWIGVCTDISEQKKVEEELKQYQEHLEELVSSRTAELTKANQELKQEVEERKQAEALLHLNEYRLQILLELHRLSSAPMKELLDFAIEQAIKLTGSRVGFFATLSEDEKKITMETRSTEVMEKCKMKSRQETWQVSDTGLWAESVRLRKPFITNDFSQPHSSKKGFPDNHVPITRHMNIPVFDGDRIAAVAGVGNKDTDYDDFDVGNLILLMHGLWEIVRRKKAEDQTQFEMEQRKQIEEQMRVLVNDLEMANTELEDFAYAVSHDLKAPLRGISSLASWLKEDHTDQMNEEGRDYLDKLINRTVRMNNLIDGVLQYSRIGRVEADPQILETDSLVRDIIEALSIPSNISVRIENPLPRVTYDKTLLIQVFQNLIGNAAKYMEKPSGQITISFSVKKDVIEFCVRDTGIGIEEKHFDRIFRIFQGLQPENEKESTGIGLSLVKKIVDRSGGKVWVESELGKGSAFYFTIPKSPDAIKAKTGLTIIMVDDNVEFSEIATAILDREGHKVLTAVTGEEALHRYKTYEGDIHLALMDVHVPDESAIERYRMLKKINKDMKIVACSGTDFKEIIAELECEGLNGFIKKPFKVEDLIRVVEDTANPLEEQAIVN